MSNEKPKRKGGRVRRRRVLKTVGITSVLSGTSLVTIGNAADGSKEIVVMRGERGEAKKSVPQDWYNHLQDVRQTEKSLNEKYEGEDWFQGAGREKSDERIAGKRALRVFVDSKNPGKARRELDKDNHRVDIRVDEHTEPEPLGHCEQYEDSDGNPTYMDWDVRESCMLGGTFLTMESLSPENTDWDTVVGWTATSHVQYDGNPMLMTCAHPIPDDYTYPGCSSKDIIGQTMYQGSRNNGTELGPKFGEIVEYDYDKDFVIIDPVHYDGTISGEPAPDEQDKTYFGHITRDGLDQYEDDYDHQPNSYGSRTGDTVNANLYKHREWGPCGGAWETRYVYIDEYQVCHGDSGSPFFIKDDVLGVGEVIGLLGHMWGGRHKYDYRLGPAAYEIADNYPISFGTATIC